MDSSNLHDRLIRKYCFVCNGTGVVYSKTDESGIHWFFDCVACDGSGILPRPENWSIQANEIPETKLEVLLRKFKSGK